MTLETIIYPSEAEAKQAKLRTAQRHQDGWRAIRTDIINLEWVVTWDNTPDPPPPPPRRLTRTQFVDELAERENVRLS